MSALTQGGTKKLETLLRRFERSEDGSMIIFGLFMFIAMLMIGGIAFDLMRHENVRTKLQNTSDAATLASANMNRSDIVTKEDAKAIVRDYFAKAQLSPFLTDIKVVPKVGSRKVSAKAQATIRTTFMRYSGVPELSVTTLGSAQQDAGDIEIAMVLDVSGSMTAGSKEANLKSAAKQFVNSVIPDGTIAAAQRPTISVIPYNDMVNVGSIYGPYWNIDSSHSNSWCTRLPDDVFDTVEWDTDATIERISHFDQANLSNSSPISTPYCPTNGQNTILMHASNPTTIKTYIDALVADWQGWTGIPLGIKWGTAMLDPSTDEIVTEMEDDDVLDERAAGLPKPYLAPTGVPNSKVLVIMTDGQNTVQRDLKPKFKTGNSDVYFAPLYESYYNNNVSAAYLVYSPQRAADGNPAWFWPYYKQWYSNNPFNSWGIPNSRLSNAELFAKMSIMGIGHYVYTSQVPEQSEFVYYEDGYIYPNATEDYFTQETLDTQTEDICDAAKTAGMIIYAVAFEAPTDAKTLMSGCATSGAYYYEVNGTDIVLAFAAIARNINMLRLTQ